jgi:type III secretion protein J
MASVSAERQTYRPDSRGSLRRHRSRARTPAAGPPATPARWFALFASLLWACSVPVAANLDDREANRVFVALDRVSIDATKEADPTVEGRWRIDVARDEVPRALAAMREEDLPRREPASVLDALGKGSLVPSEAAEHAELVAGMAGDLERSLEGIEGVLRARVHLNVPASDNRADSAAIRPTASVLIEHRGATPPLSADSIQRLIAGGVAGLFPTDVAVVMLARAAPAQGAGGGGSDLAHVGPIAVARTSMRQLQAALMALVGVVALLTAATLLLYARLARARADLAREALREATAAR